MEFESPIDALKSAIARFQVELLRQHENSARLQEANVQLQLCMISINRCCLNTTAEQQLDVMNIAIKYMEAMNIRTGKFAASMCASAEQLHQELKEHELTLPNKKD